jgi:transposase
MLQEASIPMEVRRRDAAALINELSTDRAQWKARAEAAEARLERQAAVIVQLTAENERLAAENGALKQQLAELKVVAGQGGAAEASLERQVVALEREVAQVKATLEQAQRAGKRQAAPFRRRKRQVNPKKSGRKPGHPPAHRPIPDHVDVEVEVPLGSCPHCGGEVDEQGTDEQYVVDIPPVKPQVTKYINHHGVCTRCGQRVDSRHPDQTSTAKGAASVVLGPRVLAVSIDLKERVGVPYRKVVQMLMLCFQFPVSAGALARAGRRIAKRCEPTYEAIIEYLRHRPVVHVDETGWHIANATKKAWLWVFAAPEGVTIYAIRLSRGGDVPSAILGEAFDGTLVVDGWSVYPTLGCPLAQCNAHLLRRCAEMLEVQHGKTALFPQQVKALLQQAIALGRARTLAIEVWGQRFWKRAVSNMEQQFAALLEPEQSDPDNRRFRKHLQTHQAEVLAFLHDPAIAPTNSLAEREIRPAVLVRKVSAGNRTEAGAHAHEVLASITRTAERCGVRFTDLLPALLRSPGPVILTPEHLGLPTPTEPPTHKATDASTPCATSTAELRPQRRRSRRVDRAHRATAPP